MDRTLAQLGRLQPDHPVTHYYRGLRAQVGGDLDAALGHYAAAASRQFPGYHPATIDVLAASKAVDTASGKHPGSPQRDWARLLGEPAVVEALADALDRRAAQPAPRDRRERGWIASAWYQMAAASRQGMVDTVQCREYCRHALELNPAHRGARSVCLFTLHYELDKSPDEIFALHKAVTSGWEDHATRDASGATSRASHDFPNVREPDKVLRVGYLSADFRHHPVAYFALPVLEHHDTARVESYVYYVHPTRDDYTERAVRYASRFRHVHDLNDQALAEQIASDGIDILVDLNGTSGDARLSLLARRAAPVQVTWLGSPGTTGLSAVDYRIVDAVTDPPPAAQAWNSEQLLYLPRLFSVYDPLTDLPPVAPGPCVTNGYVTFGSFNRISKINPPLLECWADILRQVPDSRLLLKYPTLDYAPLRRQLLSLLEQEGIDPARIAFAGRIPGRYEHLEAYGRVDLQLDTYPYHGTTTTCESLMMGVPVITRAGAGHRSRVGVSLLNSVGRTEWIAEDRGEYVDKACRLARDTTGLQQARTSLRAEMQASPLMDAAAFTRELEQAYAECWARWCREASDEKSVTR